MTTKQTPTPTGAITAMLEEEYKSLPRFNSDDPYNKGYEHGSRNRLGITINQVSVLEEASQKKAKEEVEEEYLSIQDSVETVYFNLTNGRVSKWDTNASVVISIVENISNQSAKEEERERIVGIIFAHRGYIPRDVFFEIQEAITRINL